MRIAAVVVTHNRPQLLEQVVTGLQRQSRPLDRIIIVDNASDAPTQALLARMNGVFPLRAPGNLGGAGGFALGMASAYAAGFDWIWLLDDDAIPRPDALRELERATLGAARGAGAVCGAVWEFGALAPAHRRYFDPGSGLERQVARRAYAGGPVQIDTATFVGFMVAASAVTQVGMPDRAMFVAYDDTDYSLRLRRAGMPVWLVPSSVVDHLRSPAARLRCAPFGARQYFNIRNRIVVLRRYASMPFLPALAGAAVGVALCLRNGDRFRLSSWRILLRAIADGWRGRLGAFPASLQRMAERHAPPLPAHSDKTP